MKTISSDNISFTFDPAHPPVETALSGETVCFQTRDCYNGQIDTDGKDFAQVDLTWCNPVTGPLYVEGAQPGDVLKVEILDIAPDEEAIMCVRTGKGVYDVEGCHCRRFPIREGALWFDNGIRIPIRPMIGVIGTCPAQPIDTETPGEHGGNLDIKNLGVGSTVYLPVALPGALLSMGDCHAIQGDGETAICGAEMCARMTVRVSVLKGRGKDIPTPLVETADAILTTSADVSLDTASTAAARKMHDYLVRATDLTDAQAAMMLSLVGDLRISQVVNPKKGCIMEFPKKYLGTGEKI